MERGQIENRIEDQGYLLLDGGLATELEARGAELKDHLWSARILLERPELLREVSQAYFEAGADILATATYQASTAGFERIGLQAEQIARIFRRSVDLARSAPDAPPTGRPRWVAGSVGPYGAVLADGSEYRGHYGISSGALRDFHARRLELILTGGPDLLALETIPSIREAELLTRLLEETGAPPAWLSVVSLDGERSAEGAPIGEFADLAESAGAIFAVGVNCLPPDLVEQALGRAKEYTAKPLLAYPNSGECWNARERRWEGREGPIPWTGLIESWYRAGCRLFGGCCRTGPDDIRRMKKSLDELVPD